MEFSRWVHLGIVVGLEFWVGASWRSVWDRFGYMLMAWGAGGSSSWTWWFNQPLDRTILQHGSATSSWIFVDVLRFPSMFTVVHGCPLVFEGMSKEVC